MAQMSRLDRAVERFTSQRAYLAGATALIAGLPGPVLEIGLGKGRTYDHLRRLMPEREIFAFDHHIHAPPDCVPDDDHVLLGDFRDSLEAARDRLAGRAAMAHADIGSEKPERDAALAAAVGPLIDRLMADGAVVVADRAMRVARWTELEPPADAGTFAYFIYRVGV